MEFIEVYRIELTDPKYDEQDVLQGYFSRNTRVVDKYHTITKFCITANVDTILELRNQIEAGTLMNAFPGDAGSTDGTYRFIAEKSSGDWLSELDPMEAMHLKDTDLAKFLTAPPVEVLRDEAYITYLIDLRNPETMIVAYLLHDY